VVDQVMVVAEDHCRRDQQRQRGGWQVVRVVGEHAAQPRVEMVADGQIDHADVGAELLCPDLGDRILVEAFLAGPGGEVLIDLPSHVAGGEQRDQAEVTQLDGALKQPGWPVRTR
jgi:hypothetical protein